jgi:hypothetical protein
MIACRLDDERVRSQEGDFFGGWITDDIAGPFQKARPEPWAGDVVAGTCAECRSWGTELMTPIGSSVEAASSSNSTLP